MTGIGDAALAPLPDEQARHQLDRPLRGGEPDPRERLGGQPIQSLERHRQVGAALVARHRVDLVDDHGVDRLEDRPAALRRDEQVQRLRRRDDEVRRAAEHRGASRRRGVARAHADAQLGVGEPELGSDLGDLGQRPLEVLRDVDGERLQRRHVDDLRPIGDGVPGGVRAVQPIDAHEEAGKGLPRPRRRRDQRVAPGSDGGPSRPLGLRRPVGEPPAEPLGHGRVELVPGGGDLGAMLGQGHAHLLAARWRRAANGCSPSLSRTATAPRA